MARTSRGSQDRLAARLARLPAGRLGVRLRSLFQHIATSAADRQLGAELQEAPRMPLPRPVPPPVIRIRLPAKDPFGTSRSHGAFAGFVLRDLGGARKLTPRRLLALDIKA